MYRNIAKHLKAFSVRSYPLFQSLPAQTGCIDSSDLEDNQCHRCMPRVPCMHGAVSEPPCSLRTPNWTSYLHNSEMDVNIQPTESYEVGHSFKKRQMDTQTGHSPLNGGRSIVQDQKKYFKVLFLLFTLSALDVFFS